MRCVDRNKREAEAEGVQGVSDVLRKKRRRRRR